LASVLSESSEELIKSHDSIRLRGLSSPGREVWIATHDNEPVHGQILELELVEDVGLVFFEWVVAQKKLASHEDRELKHSVESRRDFSDYFRVSARAQPIEQGLDENRALCLPGAATWTEQWVEHLEDIDDIYVVVEPDQGGEAVLGWLRKSKIRDRARLVMLEGVKDLPGNRTPASRVPPCCAENCPSTQTPGRWFDCPNATVFSTVQNHMVLTTCRRDRPPAEGFMRRSRSWKRGSEQKKS
jgi:hypothetical protein